MSELFDTAPTWPEPLLLSIYALYPRRESRKQALVRIAESLTRICEGEIDGKPRTQEEAVAFLRIKTEEARRQMYGRLSQHIPMATTWFHQSRYLRPVIEDCDLPKRLDSCIKILSIYPNQPSAEAIGQDPQAFAPALCAIDKALERMEKKILYVGPENHARRLASRTELYAAAVKEWPSEELKFVPSPKRWYEEYRYEQSEATWQRKPANGYQSERDQLQRLVN